MKRSNLTHFQSKTKKLPLDTNDLLIRSLCLFFNLDWRKRFGCIFCMLSPKTTVFADSVDCFKSYFVLSSRKRHLLHTWSLYKFQWILFVMQSKVQICRYKFGFLWNEPQSTNVWIGPTVSNCVKKKKKKWKYKVQNGTNSLLVTWVGHKQRLELLVVYDDVLTV